MHNWGLAGDINLPLLALFIYFTLSFPHLVWKYITLSTADTLVKTNKGVSSLRISKKPREPRLDLNGSQMAWLNLE